MLADIAADEIDLVGTLTPSATERSYGYCAIRLLPISARGPIGAR